VQRNSRLCSAAGAAWAAAGFAILLFSYSAVSSAPARPGAEWRFYGGDPGGMRYSPLDQIHTGNVAGLEAAWTYDTGDFSDGTEYLTRSAFEATPLMADGVLYVTTPFARLLALEPETGELLWQFDPKIDRHIRANLFANRGPAYWTGGENRRLLFGDLQGRLFSIDAATGRPDPDFAENGVLDLRKGFAKPYPEERYGITSPPAICGNTVITGSWTGDGMPAGASGDVRGFDVRTGERRWRFHTVPRPGELGHHTWEEDSWKDRSGVNVWPVMSVDPARGLVFLPLTSPGYDFYGGDRHGENLFSDSVVALDCETGHRQWHFQTIHHDLWDWDLPAQPSLVTVHRNGEEVPAVAQITKTGFVFVLHRETGEPLFEVEERPVPAGNIPGEQYWPTQPFPVKPRPFARQSMTRDEITNVTPESRADCLELLGEDAVVEGPLFRPITEKWTVMFPGTNGGANWGGAAFDPESEVLYVNSMDVGSLFRMVDRPEGSAVPYRVRSAKYGRFWDRNHYPCQEPPWGSLTAIDLNSGEFRWRVTLGEFDELTAKGVPKTGTPNLGGPVVTAGGLVFIAATNDSRFRAFDKETGEELWTVRLPASGHATPMTYLGPDSGKQYVVIAAGGGNKYNDEFMAKLVAFSLP